MKKYLKAMLDRAWTSTKILGAGIALSFLALGAGALLLLICAFVFVTTVLGITTTTLICAWMWGPIGAGIGFGAALIMRLLFAFDMAKAAEAAKEAKEGFARRPVYDAA